MILVDSTIWVDYFRGIRSWQTQRLDALFETDQVAVGDLILAEVLQGFDVEEQFAEALGLFQTVHLFRLGGYIISVEAARNYRTLRARGFTVRKTIDSLIATACITYGHELLHNDRDFRPFEEHLGLKCVTET
jgi:predicted nucleic acid-binding protein